MQLTVNKKIVPKGTVRVSGAKNAATRLLAASMLTDKTIRLLDFPTQLVDVAHKVDFMRAMGAVVELSEAEDLAEIDASGIAVRPLEHYNYPIRTTYLLAAGQLMREEVAYIPYPGGCKLGERKYDLHIMVWESFGCLVEETADCIKIQGHLRAAEINFPISTVGGTENALLCASVAKGRSVINNAYVTPEVDNLIELLRQMGAKIELQGMSRIIVEGQSVLSGASVRVIPDRIEALTWMVFSAITGGDVVVENVPFDLMEVPLLHLQHAGLDFYRNRHSAIVTPSCVGTDGLQPFEVACGTHPGIISDMQPFYVLLALHADGRSKVFDYRYPERTAYLAELSKLYKGQLEWKNGEITIHGGVAPTSTDSLLSTDLRGSMAMVMAAFAGAEGSSVVKAGMAMRGYDKLEAKLSALGLKFTINELPKHTQ
jgi:UDP-N-acetylglucosamine 1-carboxyvinyltransferase